MSIKLTANISNPPISGLATAHLISATVPVEIVWSNETTSLLFPAEDNRRLVCHSNNDVLRALARAAPAAALYGETAIERTQIDHWLSFSLTCDDDISWAMAFLDKSIAPVTYLVANKLTIADFALFNEMHSRYELLSAKGIPPHVQRWYNLIAAQPLIQQVLQTLPAEARASAKRSAPKERETTPKSNGGGAAERKQEGVFVDLPGAEKGKVVVRFPPEASGYLHIGHAKAALLNQYYALAFEGKLIMRFDDTNPAKENVEFENVILGDLELLQIKPDVFTHTSNYFDLMLDYCVQLLKASKAYVDDTPAEQMKLEREQRAESKNRSNDVATNLKLWQEMLNGSATGLKCCVRAKIDMTSHNGCMRDPTIYRCKNEPHPRTGTKYKVYPTYDFACPIVDAIEDVTHTLRTMEYHDRDDQFYWFIDALKLRKPYIWEYSRLNMANTVLSKRKLTWFVDSGLVDGWDDPRFPTVRGVLRRGMTVQGLREFIIAQGSSKSVVVMNWDKIWAFNKKVIDPIAPRYTALDYENRVVVNVAGAKQEHIEVPVHPKNEAIGKKRVALGPKIYIDYVDAEALKEGENATFINWGNLLINKLHKDAAGKITAVDATLNLENKDFKKTLKLTWLAVEADADAYPRTFCVYFDNIINKAVLGKDDDFKQFIGHKTREEVEMLGDPELKKCKKGDVIQLQRRGFFKVDVAYAPPSPYSNVGSPVILFSIPDGHTKDTPSSGLKINANAQDANKNTASVPTTAASNGGDLNQKISKQGELVRDLKAKKAAKDQIDVAVKTLLSLKADFKAATGTDWKPGQAVAAPAAAAAAGNGSDIDQKISKQGELVRDLKAKKAAKDQIDVAVKTLLSLKADFKAATGTDWKPGQAVAAPAAVVAGNGSDLDQKISKQGEIVRDLKAKKAAKDQIDAAVKTLLSLKADFKSATGTDWKPGQAVAAAPAAAAAGNASDLDQKIGKQGELVRELKAKKAAKDQIDVAVKTLLNLKADFKAATGTDWKPGQAVAAAPAKEKTVTAPQPASNAAVEQILVQIAAQGDQVRQLKTAKADKAAVDAAVKALLSLKAEYKQLTGSDWKPGTVAPVIVKQEKSADLPAASTVNDLLAKIAQQGDKIRQLKTDKADKATVEPEVKLLLALKTDYKSLTGSDWKPGTTATPAAAATKAEPIKIDLTTESDADDILAKIQSQGDIIRKLKTEKSSKAAIDVEVQALLALKADFKRISGKDWTPSAAGTAVKIEAPVVKVEANAPTMSGSPAKELLTKEINEQGEKVRTAKTNKAPKEQVDVEVKKLLTLKAKYKEVTGTDFPVAGRGGSSSGGGSGAVKKSPSDAAKKEQQKAAKPAKKLEAEKKVADAAGAVKKQTRLGLEATKEDNLPDWYSQVITKGELIEYYDVSGCYILRPWSFAIWKFIKAWFDAEITKMGVKECYFPIFVSKAALEKEKTHIADFAPEVAWVTKSGESELAEPIAVRPTSETVMYPAYAKWIQSYRDLPIRLNQWNNVVRWEFKHPQPFLRTREFLWQEGHTAFAGQAEAEKEVLDILELYAQVYTNLLAIPVVKGRKTEKEKFAGGDYTTTVEAFISASGRAIQGATSHHLGQNFSKMFEIVYEDPETQQKQYVFQNSWGITTRTIGVMIMVHADNQGIVLPPHVASIQAIVVPCGITVSTKDDERAELLTACRKLEQQLSAVGIRCEGDYRDNYSPGWKFNHWELKGVPVRIEVGPKDLKASQIVAVRRDTGEKLILALDNVEGKIQQLLETIHDSMLAKANADLVGHTKITKNWSDFCRYLDQKNILLSPFCGEEACEDQIKADSARDEEAEPGAPAMGAKSLCIPFDQPAAIGAGDKCVHPSCTHKPKYYTLFGRSY